jgi:tetratricopeptide (TPR) repeat protein
MPPEDIHEEDVEFTNILERFQNAMAADNPEEATNATENVFSHLEQRHLERKQTPQDRMTDEAMEFEASGDWVGAEATYLKILELPGIDLPKVWEIHSKLASLFRLLGHSTEAIVHARLATKASRELDLVSAQVMSIQSETRLLLEMGLPGTALPLLDEALELVNQDSMFDGMRPGLLVQRAKCNITLGKNTQGNLDPVQKDLDQAYGQMAPMVDAKLVTGIQANLADYWLAKSMLHFQTNSPDLALESIQKTLFLWEEIHEQPHSQGVFTLFSVSEVLKKVAEAFLKCGRETEAVKYMNRHREIRESLKLPTGNPG